MRKADEPIELNKGVPLPTPLAEEAPPRSNENPFPLDDMDVGDSFLVHRNLYVGRWARYAHESSCRASIAQLAIRKGIKVTMRRAPREDGFRVWRTK